MGDLKLRKVCKRCTDSTIKTYKQTIRRLYRFHSPTGDIPTDGDWLSSKAVEKGYAALPFNKRRHLSTAGWKSVQAYGTEESTVGKEWFKRMVADQEEYQKDRSKNKATDHEKSKFLKNGLADLKKATTEFKRRINPMLKKPPTLKTLYKYQLYMSLRLYMELPFRNDFPTFKVNEYDGKKDNYIKLGKQATFVVNEYKNSNLLGSREVSISKSLTKVLKEFLKYRAEVVKHEYLLTDMTGKKMSKQSFGKSIQKITEELTSKRIGSRILRIMHANENKEVIQQAAKLTEKMLHGSNQTKQYVKD